MGYNKKNDAVWGAAKRQTWEKLKTLKEAMRESASKSKKEKSKMSHHDTKKKPKKPKPKPKKG